MDTLSTGFTSRPPTLDDAALILELVSAYNLRILGYADYTLDDVRDELTEPGYDPRTDGWLVFDGTGALAGYGWAFGNHDGDLANLDVIASDPAVARWLLDRALARTREIGRTRGHARMTVDKGVYRADQATRALLADYGFAAATAYHRMRVDHHGPVPVPALPEGVTLREATDEETRRAAHRVTMTSFGDHFGHVDETYDGWRALREARSAFDWSQLAVLDLDGSPVAVCECTDQFLDDEDCGYVLKLGVLPSARGRGLAKYLLRRTFARDAAAGRKGTILHVDTNNTTPALGLYESVGMKPVLVIDVWRTSVEV
ncbi:MAG: GNAT family N-acetyltransferase [Micromonosporaceae bacterium]